MKIKICSTQSNSLFRWTNWVKKVFEIHPTQPMPTPILNSKNKECVYHYNWYKKHFCLPNNSSSTLPLVAAHPVVTKMNIHLSKTVLPMASFNVNLLSIDYNKKIRALSRTSYMVTEVSDLIVCHLYKSKKNPSCFGYASLIFGFIYYLLFFRRERKDLIHQQGPFILDLT